MPPIVPNARVWSVAPRVSSFASVELAPINLASLLHWHQLDVYDMQYLVYTELPKRLARRIQATASLPYIVAKNPYINQVYNLYLMSFERILSLTPPSKSNLTHTLADTLTELTGLHTSVIPNLAQGFKECSRHLNNQEKDAFLDDMIRARIGIRVIAEHFLSLSRKEGGIVQERLNPSALIKALTGTVQEICDMTYGSSPEVIVNGDMRLEFPYISVHLSYIFMELLKNAMRATVELSHAKRRADHPPILVTVSSDSDVVVFRVRDRGGGVSTEDFAKIWNYSYSTVRDVEQSGSGMMMLSPNPGLGNAGGGGPMAGLGFGLPMSRVYASYFGGSLELVTLPGHGTDVFLKVPHISLKRASDIKI